MIHRATIGSRGDRCRILPIVTRYSVAHVDIAHQRVENEVIVVNLLTGAYFSLRDTAADAWDLLTGGADVGEASIVIAERYGIDAATGSADLAPFVQRLLDEGLIAPAGDTAHPSGELEAIAAGAAYRPPLLEKFDDMEELLLLDPIHEVDEDGWPTVATEPTER